MAEQKKTEITLSIAAQSFPRTMLFNRVGLERLGSAFIFYFGLVDQKGVLDSYACAVDEEAVKRHKEDILLYVNRASPETPPDFDSWHRDVPRAPFGASPIGRVDLANLMLVARVGPLAELRFYNYAMGDVLEAQKEGKTSVESFPVALLRCELELQRSMFLHLYSTLAVKPK
jgi:hypothetical protein